MISADELLKAIKSGKLQAKVSCESPNKDPELSLMVNNRLVAKMGTSGSERPRACQGSTVNVLSIPGSDEGFTIECSSHWDAHLIAASLESCMSDAFRKFEDSQQAGRCRTYAMQTAWETGYDANDQKQPENVADRRPGIDPNSPPI